jgi:hypothetical protein
VSVLSLNYSWNSEGKTFVLLRLLEDVVRIQIKTEPYKNNHGKRNKADTVVDCRKKGKQKNPEGSIVSRPNKGEWVSAPLFD